MIDFADMDVGAELRSSEELAPVAAERFTCMSCGGSGKYRGPRVHQTEEKCFACNGKGWHKKNHFEAMKDKRAAKQKRLENKIDRRANIKDALEEQTPGLFRFMAENQDWCNIFADMVAQINDGRAMTERQHAACVGIMHKTLARRAEKDAAKKADAEARATTVDMSTIHAMFDKARESGLKKLVYRANGLVLTPAKAHSANAGGIYVKTKGGEYLGKVMGTKFMATRECTEVQKETVNAIAADPAGEAVRYGKATGECCCCGRELTDPDSIAAGIGPICASNWGF